MGGHVIDRTGFGCDSAGKNTLRAAKKEIDEIRIMNVQIEQSAAQISSSRVSGFAPARHFGKTPKARGENWAERTLLHNVLEPTPARPKAHTHGRHDKAAAGQSYFGQVPSFRGSSGERFLTKHMFACLECGRGLGRVQGRGRAQINQIDDGVGKHLFEASRYLNG